MEEEKVGKLEMRDGGDLVFVVEEEDMELIDSLGRPIHPSREPRATPGVELSSLSFPFPFASPPAHHFPIPESVPSTTPAPDSVWLAPETPLRSLSTLLLGEDGAVEDLRMRAETAGGGEAGGTIAKIRRMNSDAWVVKASSAA